jgi:hypothetical protein
LALLTLFRLVGFFVDGDLVGEWAALPVLDPEFTKANLQVYNLQVYMQYTKLKL